MYRSRRGAGKERDRRAGKKDVCGTNDATDLIWPLQAATSLYYLVIAGVAAGLAVHQTISAETNIDLSLAEDAVFITDAARLGLFTLRAYNLTSGLGGHGSSVDRARNEENVTEVMGGKRFKVRGQRLEVKTYDFHGGYGMPRFLCCLTSNLIPPTSHL